MESILLIDDDDGFRKMLKTVLEREGYDVFEATNGKEGYDLFNPDLMSLIITDIFMPEKEGIHTIFDFKSEYPEVKIIAISGGGSSARHIDEDDVYQLINTNLRSDEILAMASDFGADAILSKPVAIKEFLSVVKKTIEGETDIPPI